VWLVRLRLASLAYGEASSATRAEEPQDAWKSKATRRKRSRAKASRDDKVSRIRQALRDGITLNRRPQTGPFWGRPQGRLYGMTR